MKRFALGTLALLIRLAWLSALLLLVGLVGFAHLAPRDGRSMFVVLSPSMAPTIGTGALIVVTPTPASELQVGDVISLHRGSTVLTHRITAISATDAGPVFQTRGDANSAADPASVPASDVIGRVAFTVPFAGFGLAFLGEPVGIVSVLSFLGTLMLARWLVEDSMVNSRGALKPRSISGGAQA